MIAADHLLALNPHLSPARAEACAGALDRARAVADLTTPLRVRHFMAQIAHESAAFGSLVESMSYRDPARLDALFSAVQGVVHAQRLIAAGPVAVANCVYAGRLGNGDAASGDGFRYRGRGFIMVTGRSHYREVERFSGLPVIAQPDLLGRPDEAAEASARFWALRNINAAADRDDVQAVTHLVVGPSGLHLRRRAEWLGKTEKLWP